MIEINFENETYYYDKGKIYILDGGLYEVPAIVAKKVLNFYFKSLDYEKFEEEEFLEYIKQLKIAEFYEQCLKAIDFGLNKFTSSYDFYRTVFPIKTSCHRKQNEPQKAIDFWMENKKVFASCLSVALLTSLGAAYCDVKNYDLALRCANRAYAIQGGSKNYQTELSLLYRRIKAETNNRDDYK